MTFLTWLTVIKSCSEVQRIIISIYEFGRRHFSTKKQPGFQTMKEKSCCKCIDLFFKSRIKESSELSGRRWFQLFRSNLTLNNSFLHVDMLAVHVSCIRNHLRLRLWWRTKKNIGVLAPSNKKNHIIHHAFLFTWIARHLRATGDTQSWVPLFISASW